jgi:hypothetical protein
MYFIRGSNVVYKTISHIRVEIKENKDDSYYCFYNIHDEAINEKVAFKTKEELLDSL